MMKNETVKTAKISEIRSGDLISICKSFKAVTNVKFKLTLQILSGWGTLFN